MYKSRDELSPSCSSPDAMVAYLYGETDVPGQTVFEDHLGECSGCAAEFAELSLARLGVYEWQRDEFAELATPAIVVPYGEAGWLHSVRAYFASPAWAAGGAFAILTVAAGFWFAAPGDAELAGGVNPTSSPAIVKDIPSELRQADTAVVKVENDDLRTKVPVISDPRSPKAVKTRAVRSARPMPSPVREARNVPNESGTRTAAPRLNEFEDENDNTLRLGDMLAELETRDY